MQVAIILGFYWFKTKQPRFGVWAEARLSIAQHR